LLWSLLPSVLLNTRIMADKHVEIEPGSVVEFLEGGKTLLSLVLEKKEKRLKVLSWTGKEYKLSVNRVLPWVGPKILLSAQQDELLSSLKKIEEKRTQIANDIVLEKLWELIREEVKEAEVFWLAELCFTEPEIDQVAALGRLLLANKILFKYKPPLFLVHSAEEVKRLREEQYKKALLAKVLEEGQRVLKEAAKGPGRVKWSELNPEVADTLREVFFSVLGKKGEAKKEKFFKQLTQGLGDDEFLAFTLARNLGLIPPHFNYLLLQADYEPGRSWEETYSQEITRLKKLPLSWQKPLLKPFVSIDSASTQDIDDAFWLQREGDNFRLRVAIACPALFWPFGSELDLKVRERFSSLYLPEETYFLLPHELATSTYSLLAGKQSPALVFDFLLNKQAEVEEFSLYLSLVEVEQNLTYLQADEFIQEKKEFWPQLYALAKQLRAQRIEAGAIVVEQAEPEIVLRQEKEEIQVELLEKSLPFSQVVVAEMMILCNHYIARWAKEKELPLFYRTQNINFSKDLAGIWTRPEDIYQVVKGMAPSILDIEPEQHACLGVSCYAPITSPLRRYIDLLNQGQVVKVLQGEKPLFSKDNLQGMLPYLSARQTLVGQVQRFRPRYWKLLYFQQRHKLTQFEGVLVEKGSPLAVFSLPKEQILVRVPTKLLEEKTRVGDTCLLTFGRVDPLRNELRVVHVSKKETGSFD